MLLTNVINTSFLEFFADVIFIMKL